MASKGLIMLALAALLVGATVAQPVSSSRIQVFTQAGCSATPIPYDKCRCNSIPKELRGWFRFLMDLGQTARAYNTDDCTGTPQETFLGSVKQCTAFKTYKSFFINCGSAKALEVA